METINRFVSTGGTFCPLPKIEQTRSSSYDGSFVKHYAYKPLYETEDSKQFTELNTLWTHLFSKDGHYLNGNLSVIQNSIRKFNKIIAKIQFKDFDIEISPRNAVKYKLLLIDNKLLIITKSFETFDDMPENEVVFSLFDNIDNKEHLMSDTHDIYELVESINELMEK